MSGPEMPDGDAEESAATPAAEPAAMSAAVAVTGSTAGRITLPTYLVVGPERHGVVRHALGMAEALHRIGVGVPVVRLADAAALHDWAAQRPEPAGPVHVDVTDALFGPTAADAAAVLTGTLPARTTLTLHDVPQAAEGSGRFARRAAAYAALARFAAGTVVSSRHELALLKALDELKVSDEQEAVDVSGGIAGADGWGSACSPAAAQRTTVRAGALAVIPLPVEDRREAYSQPPASASPVSAPPAPVTATSPSSAGPGPTPAAPSEGLGEDVVLLGFLYPGKGHAEALDALALLHRRGVPAPRRVTALGSVSAGHEDLVSALRDRARAAGLEFRVTGFVPDDRLDAALLSAGIPLAAHHNVSASGSLAAWMSVGRRAVVPASRYTREMEQLRPGTLHLAEPGAADDGPAQVLAAGIAAASADPRLTRLAPGTALAPGPEDCARQLAGFWQRVYG